MCENLSQMKILDPQRGCSSQSKNNKSIIHTWYFNIIEHKSQKKIRLNGGFLIQTI